MRDGRPVGRDGRDTPIGSPLTPGYLTPGWNGRIVPPGGAAVGYVGYAPLNGGEAARIGAYAHTWDLTLRLITGESTPHGTPGGASSCTWRPPRPMRSSCRTRDTWPPTRPNEPYAAPKPKPSAPWCAAWRARNTAREKHKPKADGRHTCRLDEPAHTIT